VVRDRIGRAIARSRLGFAAIAAILYLVAIPVLVVAFPQVSNLALSVLVLLSGFAATFATLGDLLASHYEQDPRVGATMEPGRGVLLYDFDGEPREFVITTIANYYGETTVELLDMQTFLRRHRA
jgi:hypothetical protein